MTNKSIQFFTTLIIFLALTLPRIYYVERFALPLPFWDQWDSEWLSVIKPWLEGSWQISDLLKPHNEHHIVPTRILSLVIFIATGSWNNLFEARVNIPLSILAPGILLWVLCKSNGLRGITGATVIVILMGSSLPFSWENFLIGFQSQFYFLNLFTVCALVLAAFKSDKSWAIVCIILLSILSSITVASGLLTPISVIVVILIRAFVEQEFRAQSAILILTLTGIAIAAYLAIPRMEVHDFLHADNLSEFFKMAAKLMGWPLRGSKSIMSILWLPGVCSAAFLLFQRRLTHIDMLFLGCLAWSAMQIVALAYARGHDFEHMPPRYSEVLLLGLAGNSWFVLKLPMLATRQSAKKPLWLLAAAFHGVVFFSYIQRTVLDFRILKEEYARRKTQTENVCRYVATKDFSWIDKPGFQIPYPDAKKLQQNLDDPTLKRALDFEKMCR